MKTQNGMANANRQKKSKKPIILIVILVAVFVLIYPTLYVESLNGAVKDNDFARVKFLVALPGSLNYHFFYGDGHGNTPLEVACMQSNYRMIELLLQKGANPNAPEGFRQPLDYAFGSDHEVLFESVKLLVENGADLTLAGNGEANADSLLSRHDYLDKASLEAANAEVLKTLRYIVERGASVEPKHAAWKYVSCVVRNENYGVLAYLFDECGMDVNEVVAPLNKTPLMEAAKLGNLKMVDFLLSYGADKSLKDTGGKTACDYAIENGHTELAEILKP